MHSTMTMSMSDNTTTTSSSTSGPSNRMVGASSSSRSNNNSTNKVNIGLKLKQRLVQLTDNCSRESLQTLARWMVFHRKHSVALSITLMKCVQEAQHNFKRIMIYLSVAHETILIGASEDADHPHPHDDDSPTSFWNKMKQFRFHLIKLVFLPTVTVLYESTAVVSAAATTTTTSIKEKLEGMIIQWEKHMSQDEHTILVPIIDQLISIITTSPKINLDTASTASDSYAVSTNISVNQEEDHEQPQQPDTTISSTNTPIKTETSTMTTQPDEQQQQHEDDDHLYTNDNVVKQEESLMKEEASIATDTRNKKQRLMDDEHDGTTSTSVGDDTPSCAITSTTTGSSDVPILDTSSAIVAVDFEMEGIPQEQVNVEQILVPFRSIATSQIARELRNDAIERISTIVNHVSVPVVDDSMVHEEEDDVPPRTNVVVSTTNYTDDFLDLSLKEALHTIEHYRNAIQHQYAARKQCVELLIKSRCQFGSTEAAQDFFSLSDKIKLLKQHIVALQDAMELEGLDFENFNAENEEDIMEESSNTNNNNQTTSQQCLFNLEPLSWYTTNKQQQEQKETTPQEHGITLQQQNVKIE